MLLASGGMHTRESRVLASMHTLALARAENLQILLEYELVVCILITSSINNKYSRNLLYELVPPSYASPC